MVGIYYAMTGRLRQVSEPRLRLVVVVVLLFYVHGRHLRSCQEGQLT